MSDDRLLFAALQFDPEKAINKDQVICGIFQLFFLLKDNTEQYLCHMIVWLSYL